MLPQDIVTKVQQDFPKEDAVVIVQLLSELRAEDPRVFCDRILRCIVFCAQGRYDEFACAVKLARLDWRDVIMNAEYDRDWKNHLRHFELPFTQNVA
jgi:hypothetical protein